VNAASLDLNLGEYKDILNDLKNRKINLTEIANTLYSSVNEIADANAVRASWTDSLGEHTVYSDFAVAAVAVKPLSFNTFAAIDDIDEIPGLDRVYNAIDNAINRINVDIKIGEFKDIEVTLNKLDLNEKAFDIEIYKEIKIKGQTYTIQGLNDLYIVVDGEKQYIKTDEAVQVSTKDTIIYFTYNKNLAPEILNIENTVNGQFDQLQKVIDQVNGMLGQLRGIETNINQEIADAKEDINNTIHKYLDKLNNKLCNVINSAKDKVNAAMFVKGANGLGVLSQSKNMPTVIENGAVLVPTTYTAELVVPIYKKYVAITAVDGSTANLAAANTGDLNKVLDGGVRAVEFNGESGKTYEVTYAALDYAGYVSTAKYYVTVK
jgi:flagellar hook-associated protein FlgK